MNNTPVEVPVEAPIPIEPITLEDITNKTIFTMNIINMHTINETTNMPIQNMINVSIINLIRWQYVGSYKDTTMEITGSSQMELPDPELFTPFDKLTKDEVVSWLDKKLDIENLKNNIISQINVKYTTTNTIKIPWY